MDDTAVTGTWVADYSWARPDPARLAEAGCVGVMRYVGPGTRGRDLTRTELARLHDAGLAVGLVWETTSTAALAGWQAGAYDFAAANEHAERLDWPHDVPIAMAVDTDCRPDQIRGPVADTFHGAMSDPGVRDVRPYGECDVLDILCGELAITPCGWQCAAWSTGRYSPYRCLYQRWPPIWGQTVDVNDIGPMATDLLWHPDQPHTTATHEQDWTEMTTETVIADLVTQATRNAGATWRLVIDTRDGRYDAWILSGLIKRWVPDAAYLDLLRVACTSNPAFVDLGEKGAGDPHIAVLDLAEQVGPGPESHAPQ